jgi:hypothetical protein
MASENIGLPLSRLYIASGARSGPFGQQTAPRFVIDPHLAKYCFVLQRLEHLAGQPRKNLDSSANPVVKLEVQPVLLQRSDFDDTMHQRPTPRD